MSPRSERPTLLDACAVINLYATSYMPQIVRCIHGRVGVVNVVERESLYVRKGGEQGEGDERELIDLSPMVDDGLIEILTAGDDDELATFIGNAVDLDDGEAMTLALAEHRNGVVVTDDRKAIRLAPDTVKVRSSLDVVKTWIESEAVGETIQREVLLAVQERASYVPGKNHELREWWDGVLYGD